jgi:predicted ester cyclase
MRSPTLIATMFADEVWNRRNLALLDDILAPTAVTHQLASLPGQIPSAARSPEHLRHEIQQWVAAFPDLHFTTEQRVAQDDLVVSTYRVEGTHSGAWLGLAATQRQVVIRMVHTQRVANDQIVEDWLLADWHGVLHQLGLVAAVSELLPQSAAPGSAESDASAR